MYLVFAAHYNIRPCKAQYLYWFLEMVEKFPDAYFIVNDEYISPPKDRWEIVNKKKNNPEWTFKLPSKLQVINQLEKYIPEDIKNPSDILKMCTSEVIPSLYITLENIIKNKTFEGALTQCNNKTLKEVCKKYNIPVIHNEQSSLRLPYFSQMEYIDFSGVNGDTEFFNRFNKFKSISDKVKTYSLEELQKIMITPKEYNYVRGLIQTKPEYKCGVALQVDVDTNTTAYNKGWSSADVVNLAMKKYGRVLIRNHPISSMQYATTKSMGNGVIDDSKNSLEFISKCKKVITINSSVAFEAMLMGREAEILGDNPFAQIPAMSEKDKVLALNFAVFSYLVPRKYWGDREYYKFRINEKNEEALYNKGQKLVMENRE